MKEEIDGQQYPKSSQLQHGKDEDYMYMKVRLFIFAIALMISKCVRCILLQMCLKLLLSVLSHLFAVYLSIYRHMDFESLHLHFAPFLSSFWNWSIQKSFLYRVLSLSLHFPHSYMLCIYLIKVKCCSRHAIPTITQIDECFYFFYKWTLPNIIIK